MIMPTKGLCLFPTGAFGGSQRDKAGGKGAGQKIPLPAVTISLAKRKGKNAVVLAEEAERRAEDFRARHFPSSLG
jgi:hypothetical protein